MIELIFPGLGGGVLMGAPGLDDLPDFVDPTPGGSVGGTLLELDTSPEAIVWAEFVRQARGHPDLRRINTTFQTWDGSALDLVAPSAAGAPWLRFTPLPGRRERWATGDEWHSPISIHVDQITAGTAVADSINLHSALMTMIESAPFRAAMAEAGATSTSFDEGGYGERPHLPRWEPNPDATLTALGTITIDLYIEYTEG